MAYFNGTDRADTLTGTQFDDEIEGHRGADLLIGGKGNDDLEGGKDNDTLRGGGGHDELDGGSGNDRLTGGAGRDSLDGGTGDDVLTGGTGADVFEFDAGDGHDIITDFQNGRDRLDFDDLDATGIQALIATASQQGADLVLSHSAGSSVTLRNMQLADLDLSDFTAAPPPVPGLDLEGSAGNDTLRGGAGNDDIDGEAGDDRLLGRGGHDELNGDDGNDTLLGGKGNDTLEGGAGNDTLKGGAGADVFEFEFGDGHDVIRDFTNGVDRIELDDFGLAQITALIGTATQQGSDVVLTLSADTTIRINDMALAQLDVADFIF